MQVVRGGTVDIQRNLIARAPGDATQLSAVRAGLSAPAHVTAVGGSRSVQVDGYTGSRRPLDGREQYLTLRGVGEPRRQRTLSAEVVDNIQVSMGHVVRRIGGATCTPPHPPLA